MAVKWIKSDQGFTLAELMVVMVLLGIILAASYAVFDVARAGSAQSDRDAWLTREIAQPLEYAERIFQQQFDLTFRDSAGVLQNPRWWCSATTDRDHDDRLETYTFQATTDGRLLITSSEVSDSPNPRTVAWSTNNVNRVVSPPVPMFTYYDVNGSDITSMTVDQIEQYATSMKVTIIARYQGEVVQDSRRIYFRNH